MMKMIRYSAHLVLLVIAVLWIAFRLSPSMAESCYGRFVFPQMRRLADMADWPIPGLFVVLFIGLGWIGYVIFRLIRSCFLHRRQIEKYLIYLGYTVAFLAAWFYIFWGFNYNRPDINSRMNWEDQAIDSVWLIEEYNQLIDVINMERADPELSSLLLQTDDNFNLDHIRIEKINRELESVLNEFHYPIKLRPRFHYLSPAGIMLHWSTAGIYWPFTGEANVDLGVHFIKKPVTISHELAHAHGLTSEGDCNFVAYLACSRSDDKLTRYSANLSYLGHLWRDVRKIVVPHDRPTTLHSLNRKVRDDQKIIFDHHNQYDDYFPYLRNKVYDSYLKSQGLKAGISSYNYFVKLKYAYDLHK